MAETKYDKLAKDYNGKWDNKDKKRNKALRYLLKHNKDDVKPMSKKDEYTVRGYKNGDTEDVFELVVSAASFDGHPKEYDDIKAKCKKKYDCRINILEVVTR